MKKTIACICLLVLPAVANAVERKNVLEGQPAVRHRLEYRKGRFEFGPSFNFTLNRDVRHSVLFGARLAYHITDWMYLGADVGYGIGFNTGLTNEIGQSYQDTSELQTQWEKLQNRFADIVLQGDVRAAVTPMAGKLAIFSRLTVAYDFYVFAGFGFAMTKTRNNDYGTTNPGDNIDAAANGFRPGFAWGFGLHLYFNRFFAMGVEVKDLLFSDNPTGGDLTRGQCHVRR